MMTIEGLVLKVQGQRVYVRLENIMRMKEESEDAVSIFYATELLSMQRVFCSTT